MDPVQLSFQNRVNGSMPYKVLVADDDEGQRWPPTLHGTGTEDYFNTAWGPNEKFSS